MKALEIKQQLLNGNQFSNELSNWYTLFKIVDGKYRMMLFVNEKLEIFTNIDKYSKRIGKLINKGF